LLLDSYKNSETGKGLSGKKRSKFVPQRGGTALSERDFQLMFEAACGILVTSTERAANSVDPANQQVGVPFSAFVNR